MKVLVDANQPESSLNIIAYMAESEEIAPTVTGAKLPGSIGVSPRRLKIWRSVERVP